MASEEALPHWTPRPRPGGKELKGTHVLLAPLDWGAHGTGLFDAVAGPTNTELWRYMPFGPFEREAELRDVLAAVRVADGWETLVILRQADRKPLGMASYMRIREAHGSCEIGCVAFGDELKRSVEATEANALMASHVFDELGYRRYEWKCNDANEASKRAALRFGFRFEGVFRNDLVAKGKNRDTAWFSIIDREWPAAKSALDAWLAPENFDGAGRQHRRLEELRDA